LAGTARRELVPAEREAPRLAACDTDRIGRLAFLAAHAYGLTLADIRNRPRFHPEATLARMVAIALARDLLAASLTNLVAFFGEDEMAMAAACNRVAERAERAPAFATTLMFLKSGGAAILGLA
jgi:chromosomal replication initiation ATPase DnaA